MDAAAALTGAPYAPKILPNIDATASAVLAAQQSGTTFRNTSAAGAVSLTAPPSAPIGTWFKFAADNGGAIDFVFQMQAGEKIAIGGGAGANGGKATYNAVIGPTFTIEKTKATVWTVTATTGAAPTVV